MPETPEQLARQKIDAQLTAAGWVVQDYKQFNPAAGRDIALREPPLKTQALVDELCPALSTEFCGELTAIILTGTGPVSLLKSDPAKVFASAYALGAGVAPLSHRAAGLAMKASRHPQPATDAVLTGALRARLACAFKGEL